MPSKEQMRRWREGHREVERTRRLEWLAMSDVQRLHALELMYDFVLSLGAHPHRVETVNTRWHRIKRRWLQMNPSCYGDSLTY